MTTTTTTITTTTYTLSLCPQTEAVNNWYAYAADLSGWTLEQAIELSRDLDHRVELLREDGTVAYRVQPDGDWCAV